MESCNFWTDPRSVNVAPSRLQVLKGQRYRLNVIVSELRDASAVDYQTALVAFINCIIISTPQLKDRIRIRNEFIGECPPAILTEALRLCLSSARHDVFVCCRFEAPAAPQRPEVSVCVCGGGGRRSYTGAQTLLQTPRGQGSEKAPDLKASGSMQRVCSDGLG